MKNLDDNFELHLRPRPTETIQIQIPIDAVSSLKEVAERRDMSVEALLKFYIGQGLRQDIAEMFEATESHRNLHSVIRQDC